MILAICNCCFTNMEHLNFSVIVTTYNRERLLAACLDSVLNQDYPPDGYEIVVVDDGSRDGTAKLVRSLDGIRYLYQENRGWAAARNLGIAHSRGEVLVFIDDDCLAAPHWLRRYEEAYARHPEVGGVAGRVSCGPQTNLAGKIRFEGHVAIFNEFNAPLGTRYDKAGYVLFCYGANRSYLRHVLSATTFDPALRYFEDLDFDLRLRERRVPIFYDPRIEVQHHYHLSAQERVRSHFYYGRSRVLFTARYPGFVYPLSGKPAGWRSLVRIFREYPEESIPSKLSYLLVQAVCRVARHLGALSGRRHLSKRNEG